MNETVADLVGDPTSRSWRLATRYISDFVTRYKSRQTILFYEMGNEFNLLVDLDAVRRCAPQFGIRPYCAAADNFSTAALLGFSGDLVTLIKQLDPARDVSSG